MFEVGVRYSVRTAPSAPEPTRGVARLSLMRSSGSSRRALDIAVNLLPIRTGRGTSACLMMPVGHWCWAIRKQQGSRLSAKAKRSWYSVTAMLIAGLVRDDRRQLLQAHDLSRAFWKEVSAHAAEE